MLVPFVDNVFTLFLGRGAEFHKWVTREKVCLKWGAREGSRFSILGGHTRDTGREE